MFVGVECREGDVETLNLLSSLHHRYTNSYSKEKYKYLIRTEDIYPNSYSREKYKIFDQNCRHASKLKLKACKSNAFALCLWLCLRLCLCLCLCLYKLCL